MNDLFPMPAKPPRAKPRIMAHVIDAGCSCESDVAKFRCKVCGWESGWLNIATISEGKRGIPCEECNLPASQDAVERMKERVK